MSFHLRHVYKYIALYRRSAKKILLHIADMVRVHYLLKIICTVVPSFASMLIEETIFPEIERIGAFRIPGDGSSIDDNSTLVCPLLISKVNDINGYPKVF